MDCKPIPCHRHRCRDRPITTTLYVHTRSTPCSISLSQPLYTRSSAELPRLNCSYVTSPLLGPAQPTSMLAIVIDAATFFSHHTEGPVSFNIRIHGTYKERRRPQLPPYLG